jgi:hypothetical protein
MKAFTIATPRYAVESANGTHLDIFSKRVNAIRAVIRLASEYPGNTFVVIKKVHRKRKTIFSFKIDVSMDFEDARDVYQGVVDIYQKKFNKARFWRKLDESGD